MGGAEPPGVGSRPTGNRAAAYDTARTGKDLLDALAGDDALQFDYCEPHDADEEDGDRRAVRQTARPGHHRDRRGGTGSTASRISELLGDSANTGCSRGGDM